MKKFFQSKSYGFYVTLALMLLTIVQLIVYINGFSSIDRYMSWGAVYAMVIGLVLCAVLIACKMNQFATGALAIGNFVATLLFIERIYNYVIVVSVGIDLTSGFSPEFIASTTLFAILVVGTIANVFMKQTKEEK